MYQAPANRMKINLDWPEKSWKSVIGHEVKHAGSETGLLGQGMIGSNLRRRGYSKYPTLKVKDSFWNPYQSLPHEQQVRFTTLMDAIEETQGVKKGNPISLKNLEQYVAEAKKNPGYIYNRSNTGSNVPYAESDVHDLLMEAKNKYGKNYLEKLLPVLNKAWALPAAGVLAASSKAEDYNYGGKVRLLKK